MNSQPNAVAETYRIRYVSSSIVRADDHLFCLVYSDAGGDLYLEGFEAGHESGGMLYLPPNLEWDSRYPQRRGQREQIKARLLLYVDQNRYLAFVGRSLTDPGFYEQFPSAVEKLRPKPPVKIDRSPLSAATGKANDAVRVRDDAGTGFARHPGVMSYMLALCLTVWIGSFATGFGLVVPQFASLFAGFGAEVPALTEFVLAAKNLIWGLLLLGFVAQIGLFVFLLVAGTFTARRAAFMGAGANIALQLALAAAMYVPIFKLGAVI